MREIGPQVRSGMLAQLRASDSALCISAFSLKMCMDRPSSLDVVTRWPDPVPRIWLQSDPVCGPHNVLVQCCVPNRVIWPTGLLRGLEIWKQGRDN